MPLLDGKTGIVFGVANKRSSAWAIAQAWAREGAKLAVTFQGERVKEKGAELAGTFGGDVLILPCDVTPEDEIANVFNRAGIRFHQVAGMLDNDPEAWREVDEWIDAAHVANRMWHNRLGLMGHYYGGMLDI